jgi:putative transposase
LSNPPRCDDEDYIDFLIASQRQFTCTEAARSQPEGESKADIPPPAHDSFTRFLQRLPQDTEALWNEASNLIDPKSGLLVIDDTTLDKPYADKMNYVTYHWSGKHHSVVKGINLITMLWTDGKSLIPCDFKLYNRSIDNLTKNDHFQNMLLKAKNEREMRPSYVLFDSWYSSLKNLKLLRDELRLHFFTRLKENRKVSPGTRMKNIPIKEVDIPSDGRVVHLRGYGMIKVFKVVSSTGGDKVEYWATDDTEMSKEKNEELSNAAWGIEEYHRGIKQCCGVERAQVRNAKAILSHIQLSIRAFIRLELHRLETGMSWYEAKLSIIRGAIANYLAHPIFILCSTA